MKRIKLEQPFDSVPRIGLDERVRSFSLYTKYYERILGNMGGWPNMSSGGLEQRLSEISIDRFWNLEFKDPMMVPGFMSDDEIILIVKALEMHDSHSPSSMIIKSTEELEAHILLAYQVSFAHYILGKKIGVKGDPELDDIEFPYDCCGPSGRNVAISLMLLGYPNAVYAYSKIDHGYAMLPFVFMRKKRVKGVIIIDPTSDQMWDERVVAPRNLVFVQLGRKWSYNTHWKDESNLYPSHVLSLKTLEKLFIHAFYENRRRLFSLNDKRYFYHNIPKYLEMAFSNPIQFVSALGR